MMKRLVCLCMLAVAAVSCDRPRNIPDDKLVAITRDIYLANAYRASPVSRLLQSDSIDFYTPIFEKYGYKPSDFSYTIANLSRRKSVRYTDIIEEATAQLAREDSLLRARVALLDTIDARIDARYRTVVYTDSLRRITRVSDPDQPDITLPVRPGRYEIEFVYELDTADRNGYIQYAHYVTDTAGVKSNFHYRGYAKKIRKREKFDITLSDPQASRLNISLASVNSSKKNRRETLLTIDSLQITYYLPREQAGDSLLREMMPFRPLITDGMRKPYGTNDRIFKEIVRPSDLDSAGVASRRDSLVRP